MVDLQTMNVIPIFLILFGLVISVSRSDDTYELLGNENNEIQALNGREFIPYDRLSSMELLLQGLEEARQIRGWRQTGEREMSGGRCRGTQCLAGWKRSPSENADNEKRAWKGRGCRGGIACSAGWKRGYGSWKQRQQKCKGLSCSAGWKRSVSPNDVPVSDEYP